MQVDTNRVLADLNELRRIGAFKTGVSRPTYSEDDMKSRHWLVARMREVGLDADIDGIGTVLGRHPSSGPKLLSGSHIESQLEAGWLDGAYGVIAALALARTGLPVDVIAFADEEGHYGSFLGSRSLTGLLSDAEIDRLANRTHGKPLRQALGEAGLGGKPRVALEAGRYQGFLEAHIEQGTVLEAAGFPIGVVTGINGIWQYRLRFVGKQDHAGGTTMAERQDAGLAAVRTLAWIDSEFPRQCGERTVWTCGRITLSPGAPHIIPGEAEVVFHFRDLSTEVMERLDGLLHRAVQESNRRDKCVASLERTAKSQPVNCDPAIQRALEQAADDLSPGRWMKLPSGAGHDAQYMAAHMPTGMLFVPSIGGVSHHWSEDTRPEDLALGVQVLADAARRLLDRG